MSDKLLITGFRCYWCGEPLNDEYYQIDDDTVIKSVNWACPNCGKCGLKISKKEKE